MNLVLKTKASVHQEAAELMKALFYSGACEVKVTDDRGGSGSFLVTGSFYQDAEFDPEELKGPYVYSISYELP